MRLKRSAVVGGFLGFALALAVGSVAWACTEGVASPSLAPATPNRAPEGSPITVQGTNWDPSPVIIYLGESSPDKELARVTAAAKNPGEKAAFSAELVVPKVATGKYYIFAVQGDMASPPATPFEVVTPTGETRSPESASSGSPPPAQGSAEGSRQTSLRTSGGSGSPAPSGSSAEQAPAPASAPASSATPPPADRRAGAPRSSSPAPATATAPDPADGRRPALTGGPVEDASVAPSPDQPVVPAAVATAPAPVAPAGERESRPSSPVLAGDLWSGFEGASKDPANSPSLVNLPSGHGGPGQALQNGMWFFASGLVALFAGFALADVRRRRAVVVADDRPVAGA